VVTQGNTTDPQRRAALLALKLRVLVREHLGLGADAELSARPESFGRGAALVLEDTAWILLDEQAERGLGGAIAWAQRVATAGGRRGVRTVSIITERSSGILARRAELFELPIDIWHAVDRLLLPAVAEPYPVLEPIDSVHEEFRTLIEQGGAEPVVEHGVLAGEVRGLEVCRVLTDQATDETRLEVGIGAHDREAFLMLHGGRPTVEALADVVTTVQQHRFVGAPYHPLNKLGAERFLRWQSVHEPERLGAAWLQVAAPPVVRANLKDPVPCVATGSTVGGAPLVVVYSTGIDLDLVPFALDARELHSPGAELRLVVPSRDASPVTVALAGAALHPPTIVPWS
jgi:hypothetical protein